MKGAQICDTCLTRITTKAWKRKKDAKSPIRNCKNFGGNIGEGVAVTKRNGEMAITTTLINEEEYGG